MKSPRTIEREPRVLRGNRALAIAMGLGIAAPFVAETIKNKIDDVLHPIPDISVIEKMEQGEGITPPIGLSKRDRYKRVMRLRSLAPILHPTAPYTDAEPPKRTKRSEESEPTHQSTGGQ